MSNSGLPDPAFWTDRRVFVTGHTGFVGGWLSAWLSQLGARVTGFALPPATRPNFFSDYRLADDVTSVLGDIRDGAALRRAAEAAAPDIILHLAAQPLVRAAHADPVGTADTNIMGVVNVLECARWLSGIKTLVNFTTDKVYDNREWPWPYRETDPLGGHEPYAASKACAEILTHAWGQSYLTARGAGVATLRAGNIIGGGDWSADRLAPDAVRAFAAGEPLILRHPEAVRPWQHVLDAVRGLLLLAERLDGRPELFAGAWNIGPSADDAVPVGELATRMARQWGPPAEWSHIPDDAVKESTFLTLDSAKSRARLGWRPIWAVDRGLRETMGWYRARQNGQDMRVVTQNQIAAHVADARCAQAA